VRSRAEGALKILNGVTTGNGGVQLLFSATVRPASTAFIFLSSLRPRRRFQAISRLWDCASFPLGFRKVFDPILTVDST